MFRWPFRSQKQVESAASSAEITSNMQAEVCPAHVPSDRVIVLDYPISPEPRYGYGKPPHAELLRLIASNRASYKGTLESFLAFAECFARIEKSLNDPSSLEPRWCNEFLPTLDAITLYGLTVLRNPERYFEIGSGESTRFVRRAILDHTLRTRIISIDPAPRTEVDKLCDEAIRLPLEKVDLGIFSDLARNDMVFMDGSHRVFQNSDATVAFLEIVPRLKSGAIFGVHDVYLPWDYPPQWKTRYYSEQYLLAAYLLSNCGNLHILLPNFFISHDKELVEILAPIWNLEVLKTPFPHGEAFWIQSD